MCEWKERDVKYVFLVFGVDSCYSWPSADLDPSSILRANTGPAGWTAEEPLEKPSHKDVPSKAEQRLRSNYDRVKKWTKVETYHIYIEKCLFFSKCIIQDTPFFLSVDLFILSGC